MAQLFLFVKHLKLFFEKQGFLEVYPPPIVENPGMETHIHPFQVFSTLRKKPFGYLITSPEFKMKEFLCLEDEKFHRIFSLGFSFRDEPISSEHRPQFLMLEWYRKNATYEDIIEDIKKLLLHSNSYFKKPEEGLKNIQIFTVEELFLKYLNLPILDYLEFHKLETYIRSHLPQLPLPENLGDQWAWDDLFFLIFLNEIEPKFKNLGAIILKDYPAPLAALSTLKKSDKRVCERFEFYINGLEIANCFNELTERKELRNRFELQNKEKEKLYGYQLPEPKRFYKTMKAYPESSGIALGVERLFMALSNTQNFFIDS